MITLAAKESGLNREFISDIHKNSPDIMRDLYLSSNAVQYAIKAQDAIIREIEKRTEGMKFSLFQSHAL